MGIGTGIGLLVLGEILTFALHVNIPGLSENTLGIILMVAGALAISLSLVMSRQRQHSHTTVKERRTGNPNLL